MRMAKSKSNGRLKLATVSDIRNRESMATAMVLRKLILPMIVHEVDLLPDTLMDGGYLPDVAQSCVFVLSSAIFVSEVFITAVLTASLSEMRFIPMIAEDNFRFPDESVYDEVRMQLPSIFLNCKILNVSQHVVVDLIRGLFKEIAIVFAPQDYSSTEKLLKVKAAECVERILHGKLQKLPNYQSKAQTIESEIYDI